ncbi:MAG: hypothetical protein ACP5G7_05750 [Anaerolineae bacterium]
MGRKPVVRRAELWRIGAAFQWLALKASATWLLHIGERAGQPIWTWPATVHGIITRFGDAITVDSAPGKGSLFRV